MKTIALQLLLISVLAWLVWSADLWTAVSLMYPAYLVLALISFGLLMLPGVLVRKRVSWWCRVCGWRSCSRCPS